MYGFGLIKKEETIMTKNKRLKLILIAVLSVAALIFAGYCGAWLVHYNVIAAPMLANEKLEYDEDGSFGKWQHYVYSCTDTMVSYMVAVPQFLDFTGNLYVSTMVVYDENFELETPTRISLLYNPRMFSQNDLRFEINDLVNNETFIFFTDSDLNLIEESAHGVYEYFIDGTREFYEEYVLAFFSEDVFR
jgi:hypothetical protein